MPGAARTDDELSTLDEPVRETIVSFAASTPHQFAKNSWSVFEGPAMC